MQILALDAALACASAALWRDGAVLSDAEFDPVQRIEDDDARAYGRYDARQADPAGHYEADRYDADRFDGDRYDGDRYDERRSDRYEGRYEGRYEDRYASEPQVRAELRAADAMYSRHRLPVIDTSAASVEEIAAIVIQTLARERRLAADTRARVRARKDTES